MFPWITRALDGRLYEWALAVPTLALGIELVIWPDMISASAFSWMENFISCRLLTVIVLIVGTLRLFALGINGRSAVFGPMVRSICALLSAVGWSQFAYALFVLGAERDIPSPGTGFWVSFMFAEIYVSYRAVMDVRRAY